jgi:hypothetical protein
MHSPSYILPHFYAAIVKAGSLIKTKRDSFHAKKKETSLEYCYVRTFLSGLGLKNVRDYSYNFVFVSKQVAKIQPSSSYKDFAFLLRLKLLGLAFLSGLVLLWDDFLRTLSTGPRKYARRFGDWP